MDNRISEGMDIPDKEITKTLIDEIARLLAGRHHLGVEPAHIDAESIVGLFELMVIPLIEKRAKEKLIEEIEKGCGHYDKDWHSVAICDECWRTLKEKED